MGPGGQLFNALTSGHEVSGLNSAVDGIQLMTTAHHCTEPFIIPLLSSRYDLNNVEREVKHQVIIIVTILANTENQLITRNNVQYNLNGSNPDGLFTPDDSNSFFSPYKILPIAQENKYLGIFFLFYHGIVCCVYSLELPHRGNSIEYTQHAIIV